jgi:predicted phage tail protein
MYSIKVAVDSNGNQYAAGMGIGVQNTPAGMQSQVLFLADRFAVMTQAGGTVTLPFVIQNGQVFINDALSRMPRLPGQNWLKQSVRLITFRDRLGYQ